MQVSTLDFSISILTFTDNAADAEIKGVEADLIWVPTEALSLFANVSYNDTELTKVSPDAVAVFAGLGSELALSPKLQYTLRARYDWVGNTDYEPFAQVGMQFTDDTLSSLVLDKRFPQPDYTTFDASFGIRKDTWSAMLFIENISDERAVLFIDNSDDIVKTATNRPRTIGLRFSYDL